MVARHLKLKIVRFLGASIGLFLLVIPSLSFAQLAPELCLPRESSSNDFEHIFDIKNPAADITEAPSSPLRPSEPELPSSLLNPSALPAGAMARRPSSQTAAITAQKLTSDELQSVAQTLLKFYQEQSRGRVEPATRQAYENIFKKYGMEFKAGGNTLASAVSELLQHYLRWDHPSIRNAQRSQIISDFAIKDDPLLANYFQLEPNSNRTLMEYIFNELLLDPAKQNKITATEGPWDILYSFKVQMRGLLLQSHPKLYDEAQREWQIQPEETAAGSRILKPSPLFLTFGRVRQFTLRTRDLSRRGGGLGTFMPLFKERLEALILANNGHFKTDLVFDAINFSPVQFEEFEKRKKIREEIVALEISKAGVEKTHKNFGLPSAYRGNSSIKDFVDSKIQRRERELDYQTPLVRLTIEFDDFKKNRPVPAIQGWGKISDDLFTPAEKQSFQDALFEYYKSLFDQIKADRVPDPELIKKYPFLNPSQYIPSNYNFEAIRQAGTNRHSSYGVWQTPAPEEPSLGESQFEQFKKAAIKAQVDKALGALTGAEFGLKLESILEDGLRYDSNGFYPDRKAREKNAAWYDPILGRERQPKTKFFDFAAEVEPKYWPALYIVSLVKNDKSIQRLPYEYAHLLTWSKPELETLAQIKKSIPSYGNDFISDPKKQRPSLERLRADLATIQNPLLYLGEFTYESMDDLKQVQELTKQRLIERDTIASGLRFSRLGCFDTQSPKPLRAFLLPEGPQPEMTPEYFEEYFSSPKDREQLSTSLNQKEFFEKMDSCLVRLREERNRLEQKVMASWKLEADHVFTAQLEAAVKAKLSVLELLRSDTNLVSSFLTKLNGQSGEARRSALLAELLAGTKEDNEKVSRAIVQLMSDPSKATARTKPLVELLQKSFSDEVLEFLKNSMKDKSLEATGFNGIRNLSTYFEKTYRLANQMDFKQWSLVELDAVNYIQTHHGWESPVFSSGLVDLGLYLYLLTRSVRQDKKNGSSEESASYLVPALDLEDSAELLVAADELARSEVLIPAIYGKDWKKTLLNEGKEVVTPFELRSHGMLDAIRVIEAVSKDQIRASHFFGYNERLKFFPVPQPLKDVFESEVGTLQRLKAYKVPTNEKHLNYLRSVAAHRILKQKDEVFRQALKQDTESETSKARLAKMESAKAFPSETLIELIRETSGPGQYEELARKMGLSKPGELDPQSRNIFGDQLRVPYAAGKIQNLHTSIFQSLIAGMRSYDFFLQDFFGESSDPQTREMRDRFSQTYPQMRLGALEIAGFDTKSEAFRRTLREIEEKNEMLFKDLEQISERFVSAGRSLAESLDKSQGLSRKEFLKIFKKAKADKPFNQKLLGLNKFDGPKEGFDVSKSKARELLKDCGILVSEKNEEMALKQVDWLRDFVISAQMIFKDFNNSLSSSVLKYSIPLMVNQVILSDHSSEVEKTAAQDSRFLEEVIATRLGAVADVTNLSNQIDIRAVARVLSDAHLKGNLNFKNVDQTLRNIVGELHDLQRLLYGQAYDKSGGHWLSENADTVRGWEESGRGGFEIIYRRELDQKTSGRWKNQFEPDLLAKIESLNSEKKKLVDSMRTELAKVATHTQVDQFLKFLDSPFSVTQKTQDGGRLEWSGGFVLKRDADVAKVVGLAQFSHTPVTSRELFGADYRSRFSIPKKYGASLEESLGGEHLETLMGRLGDRRTWVAVLKSRFDNMAALLTELGQKPELDSLHLAEYLNGLYEKGDFDPDIIFTGLRIVVGQAASLVDPRTKNHAVAKDVKARIERALSDIRLSIPDSQKSSPEFAQIMKAISLPLDFSKIKVDILKELKNDTAERTPFEKALSGVFPGIENMGALISNDFTHFDSVLTSYEKYYRGDEEKVGAVIHSHIDKILSDPYGKKVNLQGRLAPYAHTLKGDDEHKLMREMHKTLIEFLWTQPDSFFSPEARKESTRAIYEHFYGDRFGLIEPRMSEFIQVYNLAISKLLETMNVSRMNLKGVTGAQISSEDLKKLIFAAVDASVQPNSKKTPADLLRDNEFTKTTLKSYSSDEKTWSSDIQLKQRQSLIEQAESIATVFQVAGQVGLTASTNLIRNQLKPIITDTMKQAAQMKATLGYSIDDIVTAMHQLNRKQLKEDYKELKASRETRERADQSLPVYLLAGAGHILINGATRMWDEVYRLGIENIGIAGATWLNGDEGFEASSRFFGQFSNSNYSEDALARSDISTAGVIAGDSVGLFLTMVSFGVSSVVEQSAKSAASAAAKAVLKSELVGARATALARSVRVGGSELLASVRGGANAVGAAARRARLGWAVDKAEKLASPSFWTTRRFLGGGMSPTSGVVSQGAKVIGADMLRGAGTREATRPAYILELEKAVREKMIEIARDPKLLQRMLKNNWPTIKIFGAKMGFDSLALALWGAGVQAYVTKKLSTDDVDGVKLGFIENLKLMMTFMAMNRGLKNFPILSKGMSVAILNEIWGSMAQNNMVNLLNSSDGARDFLNHVAVLELQARGFEFEKPSYEKYFRLGEFDKMTASQKIDFSRDPKSKEMLKEYNDAMMTQMQALSSLALAGIVFGSPYIAKHFDRKNTADWEKSTRPGTNGEIPEDLGFSGVMAFAYGGNPKRTYDFLVEHRVKYLTDFYKSSGKSPNEIQIEARAQIDASFWSFMMMAIPEKEVARTVAFWKLQGRPVEELRPLGEAEVRRSHELLFAVESTADAVLNTAAKSKSLADALLRFNRAFDEGLEMGSRLKLLEAREMNSATHEQMESLLKSFGAIKVALEQNEALDIAARKMPMDVIQETIQTLGQADQWNTPGGKILLNQIVIPWMRAREQGRTLPAEFLGVDLSGGKDSSGRDRLNANLISEAIQAKVMDPSQPAQISQKSVNGVNSTIFSDGTGTVLGALVVESGARYLQLQGTNYRISIPEGIDVSMTNGGRIMVSRMSQENGTPVVLPNPLRTDSVLDFNLRVEPLPSAARGLPTRLNQAESGKNPVRLIPFWIQPKPSVDSPLQRMRPRFLERRVEHLLAETLSPEIEMIQLPNGSSLIRYSGENGLHRSRTMVLSGRFEVLEAKDGILKIRDSFGVRTEHNFREDSVKFFKESPSGSADELVTWYKSSKTGSDKVPMNLDDYSRVLENFPGLIPSEVHTALVLNGAKVNQLITVSSTSSIAADLARLDRSSLFDDLGVAEPSTTSLGLTRGMISQVGVSARAALDPTIPAEQLSGSARRLMAEVRAKPGNASKPEAELRQSAIALVEAKVLALEQISRQDRIRQSRAILGLDPSTQDKSSPDAAVMRARNQVLMRIVGPAVPEDPSKMPDERAVRTLEDILPKADVVNAFMSEIGAGKVDQAWKNYLLDTGRTFLGPAASESAAMRAGIEDMSYSTILFRLGANRVCDLLTSEKLANSPFAHSIRGELKAIDQARLILNHNGAHPLDIP